MDQAIIYFDHKALEIKNKEALDPEFIKQAFGNDSILVCTTNSSLEQTIHAIQSKFDVIVFMGSGNFGGIELV